MVSNSSFDPGESNNDAPFNMSLYFYMSLQAIIDDKDKAYLKDDIYSWFKHLYVIYTRISFKLKEDGLKHTEKSDMLELIGRARQKLEKNDKSASAELHELDQKIVDAMDKYKMIFPRIDTAVGLSKIDKRYGLGAYSQNAKQRLVGDDE